ncbi:MAG: hypothetical protein WDM88_02365 [Galbitalea sp.]
MNPDTGNLLRLHRPVEDWYELLERTLPFANFWHVKNYQRDEDPNRGLYFSIPSPLESGVINYREAVELAVSSGFQGIICCEHYGGDGLSVSAVNQRYLRQVLPENADYVVGRSRVIQRHERTNGTGLL